MALWSFETKQRCFQNFIKCWPMLKCKCSLALLSFEHHNQNETSVDLMWPSSRVGNIVIRSYAHINEQVMSLPVANS